MIDELAEHTRCTLLSLSQPLRREKHKMAAPRKKAERPGGRGLAASLRGTNTRALSGFLREARIERVGVFPFSPEEGTPAAAMDHVDTETAQRRADLIMELQAPIMDDYCNSFLGKTIRVLYEYYDEESGYHVGRSYADSPDIDGLVLFSGDCAEGDMVDVLITDTDEGLLIGEQV